MKFDVGSIHEYQGEDLIFVMGAPGSRFSAIYRVLSQSVAVNTSETKEGNVWCQKMKEADGVEYFIGTHRGVYYGPGNVYGESFDQLNRLSKTEILNELMMPYENWDKIKIMKSHWFLYNIEYLQGLFPKAKFVMCYANDVDCFYWWHKCGGWGMPFPNYTWYNNDETMIAKIKEENYNLLRFVNDKKLELKYITLKELHEGLKLPISDEAPIMSNVGDPVPWGLALKCQIALYSGEHIDDFNHLVSLKNYHLLNSPNY